MDFDADNQNLIGIFTTDERFFVRVWDAALAQMSGISAEEARGKPVFETIPDLEARGLRARFERVLMDGTIEILSPAFHRFLIECPPLLPSRHFSEMRQRVTIAPLREDEMIRGLLVTIEDVTARIEREIELTEQLKDADEAIRLRAAKHISRAPENLGEETAAPIIDALGDKNWRVRRELVEGLARRAAPEAIAALLRAMQERHLDFGVLNSALRVLQATSVKTTETLIEFLRGDDADLRMQAALTLGEQRAAPAIPALIEALADEDANVRYHVIEALGKQKAAAAVEPLLAIAEKRDFFLSFVALDALRQIADSSAAPRIVPFLADDFLREAAIETLGALGDEAVVSPLIDLLNAESSPAAAVAAALASIDERSAPAAGVVERARQALDANGKNNLRAALNSAGESALPALVRFAGWFDDEKIRAKIAALLIENENARETAAQALIGQGAEASELFIEMLAADDAEIRRTAAAALGEIGDFKAFGPLRNALENGDAATRRAVVGAFQALCHPETVARLCDLLTDDDDEVREAALRIIGHFGGRGCEETILAACRDADARVRRAALEQLPKIADERAVPTLVEALRDGAPRDRETAAKALAAVDSGESVAALRAALGDADSWTRYFAIRALGSLRDASSVETLNEMSELDPAEHVRAAAREVSEELKA